MTDAPQTPPDQAPPQAAEPPAQAAEAKRDTTLAMLAHLLLIVPGVGIVGPLIVWLIKKDEDTYVNFHGKQALCWGVTILILMAAAGATCVLAWLIPLLGIANLVYVIIAAVKTNAGQPFKYPLVANWFCKDDFARAYPDLPTDQQQTPPGEQTPPQAGT
ncbi:hypothetical protein LCGC14_2114080 [marine sediment metagenome]|uniref:DUF4870 domain-containing protein n=1 Tax=marine sediment metagenome TaxID=412755 RepID=A0A0F9GJA6_9ZZZZ